LPQGRVFRDDENGGIEANQGIRNWIAVLHGTRSVGGRLCDDSARRYLRVRIHSIRVDLGSQRFPCVDVSGADDASDHEEDSAAASLQDQLSTREYHEKMLGCEAEQVSEFRENLGHIQAVSV
jgi:hypothetical protein